MYFCFDYLFVDDERVHARLGRGCRVRYIFSWSLIDSLLDFLCMIFMTATANEETNSSYCIHIVGANQREERQEKELHWMIQYTLIRWFQFL